jgi:sarcosine oxidase subunit alpha
MNRHPHKDLRIPSFPRGKGVTLFVDGEPVRAFEGETVLAALTAAGVTALRRSRTGTEDRGVLCGMGVCYECRVTIDGRPGQRACMRGVEDGMEIVTDDRKL